MSEKKINLEEICSDVFTRFEYNLTKHDFDILNDYKNIIHASMKEACRQAIELAAENAECEEGAVIDFGFEKYYASVNKQSILDTINQIE